jgi:AraC-like DNA-binding protein
VTPVLRELRDTWGRHDPAERHLADATLRRALALVNRDRRAGTMAAAARAAADRRERIRPVLAYVDRHRRESITLDDVAQVVHVSPSRVRHVFKDVTGVSFKEYVTHVRVAEAKRLLLATDLSVAEVAGAVSYTNLHQFYRVFYRSCAMSPGEYRRYYTPAGGEAVPAPAR